MKCLVLNSPAKVNLFLNVTGKRPDGYHEVETVLEKIDLCDEITLTLTNYNRISISSNTSDIPCGGTNLAYQAAKLLLEAKGVKRGVKIEIWKNIPVAGGLGGGSSNAAAVLKGLNELLEFGLAQNELVDIGEKIGTDVSFFLIEDSVAIGRGRGDQLCVLQSNIGLWHVLIYPNIRLSTKECYENFKIGLTKPRMGVKILCSALESANLPLIGACLYNSLERWVVDRYEVVANARKSLEMHPVSGVSLSGSGSTIFGLVPDRHTAEAIRDEISSYNGWQVVVARTYQMKP